MELNVQYYSLIAIVAERIITFVIILRFTFMLLAGTFCLGIYYILVLYWLSLKIILDIFIFTI